MLYSEIGLTSEIIGLATGTIEIPNCSTEQPARCYGYPPALIPFWSDPDGMIYTGLWKHWFGDRTPCFVKNFVNVFYRSKEISRSPEQLLRHLINKEISLAEEISPEILSFSQRLGVTDIAPIEEIYQTHGDVPSGLLNLPDFFQNAPLSCFSDPSNYSGDFPHIAMKLTSDSMRNTCSLELNETLEKTIRAQEDCPMWYNNYKKTELFSFFMDEERHAEAWFTLNSNGWLFADVYKALERLASAHDDPVFHMMVSAWCSKDQGRYKIGY